VTPTAAPGAGSDGLIVVDKPAGWTSHDVVARIRRLAGTRRVGHAGTLDPPATGVLVVGVNRATRLLHHLVATDKSYAATIRLGASTVTDDATGALTSAASAAGVTAADLDAAVAALTGEIDQVPSAVSAVKVGGERAYKTALRGEAVQLAPRRVTVSRFEVPATTRPSADLLDVEVEVDCSSGTYVRALARDLGARLGVGGHLTALRRTRVGPFRLDQARTLEELAELDDPVTVSLAQAVRAALPVRDVAAEECRELSFGRRISGAGISGTYGAIGPDGTVVALLAEQDGRARPVLVFTPFGRARR
jgi:tRNA pseudouridine55 synthase